MKNENLIKYKRTYEAEQRRIESLRTPEARLKMSLAKKGKTPKNFNEAQEKAWAASRKEILTYAGIHAWVRRNWGNPTICEICFKNEICKRKAHWANKDHKYSRNREDWMRVCRPCHAKYDQENNGINFTRISVRK